MSATPTAESATGGRHDGDRRREGAARLPQVPLRQPGLQRRRPTSQTLLRRREVWRWFKEREPRVFDPEPPITLGRACEEMWRRLILDPRPITMTWKDVRVTMEKLTEVKP